MCLCFNTTAFAASSNTGAEGDVNVKGAKDDAESSDVPWVAIEEKRKGEQLIASAESEQQAFEEMVATYFSESDIVMLAQLIDIEANSVYPLNRRAAVGWTVLNRLDNGRWGPTTIAGIISQPGQYAWYSRRSYSQENYDIAKDGRVLPPNYDCFYGDGSQNHFYDVNGSYWDFSVPYDPYENW